MRSRRNPTRRPAAIAAAAAAGIGAIAVNLMAAACAQLWLKAMRRPVDSLALVGAAVLSLVIVVNAVFLQSGSRTAPFFANPVPHPLAGPAAPMRGARLPVEVRTAQSAAARSKDPIGALINSFIDAPTRVIAVQRVLSEYGYGQIRLTGVVDTETRAAIAKFESGHHMPVTGRLSEQLMSELAAMTGRPL